VGVDRALKKIGLVYVDRGVDRAVTNDAGLRVAREFAVKPWAVTGAGDFSMAFSHTGGLWDNTRGSFCRIIG
jgi:hypothetical protein